MQCALGDAELSSHTTQGENGLTVSYSTCPICHGYWMDSFSANFIKLTTIRSTPLKITPSSTYYCPICNAKLVRSTGDTIPDEVSVYECPHHHGYFFPTGQLAAFKKAQQAKIDYHKLWHIAMPNVNHILLGSFLLLVLSGGILITLRELQQQQTMQSQAKQILADQHIYVADHTTILISATTSVDALAIVHIPALNNFSAPMQTTNHRTHQLTIINIPPGTYHYFFTITFADHSIQSDTFIFTLL